MAAEKQIAQLYIGYFNRCPDREGLDFWVAQADAGASIAGIASSFSRVPEYQSIYGGLSNGQLVDKIYANLFDRAPDMEGRTYWLSALESGFPVSEFVLAVMNGAQGNDRLTLENTAIVAKDWTDSNASQPFDLAAAQNAVQSIGEVQGNGVTIDFGGEVFQPYEAFFQSAMQAAWKQWGNHGMLDVRLNFADYGGNTLAFATPRNEFFTGQTDPYGTPITQSNVGVEVNTGKDMNGDLADITITIAMNLAQFFQYDTVSILAHEIGHGLGFRTEAFDFDENYSTVTSWDQFITLPTGATGQAFFNGPEAMLVYGGPVPIVGYYNATHTDGIGSIMDPTFGLGEFRYVGVLDKAMMHDIGIMV